MKTEAQTQLQVALGGASGLPVAGVAVTLLELAAGAARAGSIPPHLGVLGAVPRGGPLLRLAGRVVARGPVLQPGRPPGRVQASAREARRDRRGVRSGARVRPRVGAALPGVG